MQMATFLMNVFKILINIRNTGNMYYENIQKCRVHVEGDFPFDQQFEKYRYICFGYVGMEHR